MPGKKCLCEETASRQPVSGPQGGDQSPKNWKMAEFVWVWGGESHPLLSND